MYYDDYLSPALKAHLLKRARPVAGVRDLVQVGEGGGLETTEALQFLSDLHEALAADLALVLKRRTQDRAFIDQRARALYQFNQTHGRDYLSGDYLTVLGLEDGEGRIVVGPKRADYVKKGGQPIAPIPSYLQGPHVTLFGPPDSAKLAINAMNAYHRQLPGEPAIVGELLSEAQHNPKWGADDEDSKTPLRADLISAGVNLKGCFAKTLSEEDKGKRYELKTENLALPIKRFPGLALPSFFMFKGESPLPLHLYDFALHFFHHATQPEALVFYVPKLENEEEARYIRLMMETAEKLIQKKHPSYKVGTIRLMIVLENPRAIFRTHEIMDELYPYFAGASLGWHDYLASTARLFKEDGNYRIPVKADPNIVIKYIKASHRLLADVVGPRGGIKVGGMYGILPIGADLKSPSFQITLKGYFKDVITQMKRDLTGFWVAHPDFVRLGLALVAAWKKHQSGDGKPLSTLVSSLLEGQHAQDILAFIQGPDIEGLNPDDPMYARSLIVADIRESNYIANNHPDEVRYNVFQCLQYLADWLTGNGCVALPAQIDGVAVRVMDDLATTERSRWEVWHEIRHGRFSLEEFLRIAHEELHFIRKDLSDDKKIVQVKWDERTAKWYPVAFKLMLRLMTDKNPAEFATELLLPFTIDEVRASSDPWKTVEALDGAKFCMEPYIQRFNQYFECLGSQRFASVMARHDIPDYVIGAEVASAFMLEEVIEAASFHGDIGEGKKTLDERALKEQEKVFGEEDSIKEALRTEGAAYKNKFGVKFLVSAQGKSGSEMLAILRSRMNNSAAEELVHARTALWEIGLKRMKTLPQPQERLQDIFKKHNIRHAQVALTNRHGQQTLSFGHGTTSHTLFEVASLSKTVASAFACEYFAAKKISLNTSVNQLLAQTKSTFRLAPKEWGDKVTLAHLMSHQALNMHYVNGVPADRKMPAIEEFLNGNKEYNYPPVSVINEPGTVFKYSGAGFIVLEHLLEALEGGPIGDLTASFLIKLGVKDFTFTQETMPGHQFAHGYRDDGTEVPGTRLMFPAFAAGAMGTAGSMAQFLTALEHAYHNIDGFHGLSHDTARSMLHGSDLGCREFMGCTMGLGVFILEAGENRFAVHQGANDGFRCLYLHCYTGPDRGFGLTVLCNAELNGVLFNAEIAQEVLKLVGIQGVDTSKFKATFVSKNLKQEEVVNIGYRDLLFNAFERTRPEEIIVKGVKSPLADKNLCVGGTVLSVTNDLFARAENLLSPFEPVFDPELFGKQGKIMDSWETVRHNPLPHDEMIFALKKPSVIRAATLSTKYHYGNHAPVVRLEGLSDGQWFELIGRTELDGHALKYVVREKDTKVYSQIKVQMFPDGGFTRLGLYAEELNPAPASGTFKDEIPKTKKPLSLPFKADADSIKRELSRLKSGDVVNVASLALGAKVLKASNEHYGPAAQVISPFIPLNMFDGLESARSRIPGHFEEVTVALAKPSELHKIELDFTYFVNNNPREVVILGLVNGAWKELVPKTYVKSFAGDRKAFALSDTGLVSELRVQTHPCGGLNRLKAFTHWTL